MRGFVKSYRERFDHPLFKNENFCRGFAWDWMVARAVYSETEYNVRGAIITLNRGQFVASPDEMAKVFGWTRSSVNRFLTRLKSEHMIELSTGHKKTVITICNYDIYQGDLDQAGQSTGQPTGHKSDTNRTVKEEYKENKEPIKPKKPTDDLFNSKQESEPKPKAERPKFPDFIEKEVESAYREYRQKKKAPLTDRAVKLLGNRLIEIRNAGFDPNAALDKAMEKGWSGLELDWIRNSNVRRLNGVTGSSSLGENAIRMLNRGEIPPSLKPQFESSGMPEPKFIQTMLEGAR